MAVLAEWEVTSVFVSIPTIACSAAVFFWVFL